MSTSKVNYPLYVSVILDAAIDKTFDYGVPETMASQIRRGLKLQVPVRGHLRHGYVAAVKTEPDYPKVLPIASIAFEEELITEELFELALWMAKYYCTPINSVIRTILPAGVRKEMQHKEQLFVMRGKTKEELRDACEALRSKSHGQAQVLDEMLLVKKGILLSELLEKTGSSRSPVDTLVKKGLLLIDIVRVDRSPLINEEFFKTQAKILNEEQKAAFEKICSHLHSQQFATHLLHGVTGSGKTEVYLQAIDQALKMGRSSIMLVPEISLTAQTIERFKSRFEDSIAILHHRLSDGERFDEWHKIRRGEAKIVIGARSAIFSPVQNLGVVIVDEEHEQTYKQHDGLPSYHARDIAVMRGKFENAVVILGSATPSLESYYNAQKGKYILSSLNARADSAALPTVAIVDMKLEFEKNKGYTNFSDALLTGMKKRIEAGEQTILFLNRRGYHSTLFCKPCAKPIKCSHCDTALTFHLGENALACHLCGFNQSPPPKQCPACKAEDPMKYRGVGTEQVERALHAIFPHVRTIRMDADTTRHKGSHQKLLRAFGTGKADVLIGTQMIAKGLHFPSVTLVGVLNSDTGLNIPDFRASENIFQLITQVAGRAGRGAMKGEVIIQTCMPDNSTIQLASQQNYEKFYADEIGVRQVFDYPPHVQMAKLTFSGIDERFTHVTADKTRTFLAAQLTEEFKIHPIIPSGYAKIKDKFRFQCLIRGPSIYPIAKAIELQRRNCPLPKEISLHIDINPTSTFF